MTQWSAGAVNEPLNGALDGARQPHGGVRVDRRLTPALDQRPRKRGSQRAFARRFGVSESTISMIVNGNVWVGAP